MHPILLLLLAASIVANALTLAAIWSYASENKRLRDAISPFDHDGDGRPGG